MKVLLFSHEYPPCIGGAGSVAESIFTSFKRKNINITLLTSSRTNEDKNNFIFTERMNHKLWFISYASWLKKHISQFDLIICNDPAAIYNAGKYFPEDILAKTVCLIHGEEKYLNKKYFIINKLKFSNYFKKAINMAKKIIFVSEYIKDRYAELYNIKLDDSKYRIIHSGVKDSFSCTKNILSKEKNTFLTVSRLEKAKGFDTMLQAFCKVKESGIDFKWYIAGNGSYYEDFAKIIKRSPINENIVLLGKIERSKLPEIYQKAYYYISLSELNESYGLSYLEAATCGTTPIGYNRCGTKEAFKYIDNGILIDNFKDKDKIGDVLCEILKISQTPITSCSRSESDFIEELINNVF